MKIKSKIIISSITVAVISVIVWAVAVIGLQIHQAELDHELIAAIKIGDAERVVALLKSGANANSTDKPYSKPTAQTILKDIWLTLKGKKRSTDTNVYAPAIILVYPQDDSSLAKDHEYILGLWGFVWRHVKLA